MSASEILEKPQIPEILPNPQITPSKNAIIYPENAPISEIKQEIKLKNGQYILTPIESFLLNKIMPKGFKFETEETTKKSFQKTKSSKNTQPADATSDLPKKPSGPSKSQINRLKKFYNTTRWLPNSAFTTYFGKPAFENYGYGNTNPTYGGLFYGKIFLWFLCFSFFFLYVISF